MHHPVITCHGLTSRWRQIDDRQSPVAQAHSSFLVKKKARIIRAPVDKS